MVSKLMQLDEWATDLEQQCILHVSSWVSLNYSFGTQKYYSRKRSGATVEKKKH